MITTTFDPTCGTSSRPCDRGARCCRMPPSVITPRWHVTWQTSRTSASARCGGTRAQTPSRQWAKTRLARSAVNEGSDETNAIRFNLLWAVDPGLLALDCRTVRSLSADFARLGIPGALRLDAPHPG